MIATYENRNSTSSLEANPIKYFADAADKINQTINQTIESWASKFSEAPEPVSYAKSSQTTTEKPKGASELDRSTSAVSDIPWSIITEIYDAFASATNIDFEYGMDNAFLLRLEEVVEKYGVATVKIIRDIVVNSYSDAPVLSEALRYLGDMNHSPTYRQRLFLLVDALKHDDSYVRDGAILGLAAMDDPRAIPYLEDALKSEHIAELREDMKLVINQLEGSK